jgi:hypothetical protein
MKCDEEAERDSRASSLVLCGRGRPGASSARVEGQRRRPALTRGAGVVPSRSERSGAPLVFGAYDPSSADELRGDRLYGDDFTHDEVVEWFHDERNAYAEWFQDERNAYADLGSSERSSYVYG